jgi:hypothetical protein
MWLGNKYKGKFSGQRQTKNVYERSQKRRRLCHKIIHPSKWHYDDDDDVVFVVVAAAAAPPLLLLLEGGGEDKALVTQITLPFSCNQTMNLFSRS